MKPYSLIVRVLVWLASVISMFLGALMLLVILVFSDNFRVYGSLWDNVVFGFTLAVVPVSLLGACLYEMKKTWAMVCISLACSLFVLVAFWAWSRPEASGLIH
ncbi:MAG: hypothetical protein ACSHYB_07225 [Roseibacillus sp.]